MYIQSGIAEPGVFLRILELALLSSLIWTKAEARHECYRLVYRDSCYPVMQGTYVGELKGHPRGCVTVGNPHEEPSR